MARDTSGSPGLVLGPAKQGTHNAAVRHETSPLQMRPCTPTRLKLQTATCKAMSQPEQLQSTI